MTRPDVVPFLHPSSGTWSYLVVDPDSRDAAIIDPVLDFDAASGTVATDAAQAIVAAVDARQARVRWILETHAHADHLSAGDWLRTRFAGATLAIGDGIRRVQRTFVDLFNLDHVDADGSQFDRLFRDGETFALGSVPATVIATPGHTDDSVSYLIGDALFTGDTLFMPDGGTARCDFPGGDAGRLHSSIERLFALPDSTRVFVCHDYAPGGREHRCETTIGAQKADNIHVGGGRDREAFVRLRKARDATLPVPALLLPAVQVNIRGGALPAPERNGVRYLKIPIDQLRASPTSADS